ncbi:TetR/AcrR family transcriptional regulator [Nocardia thailandica]
MSEPLRDRLVEVGADLLEELGAGGLGLRAVARAAGVSHGAPRRWFPTHAALLAAIAHRGFTDLATAFAGAPGGPRERLRHMAVAYVRFAAERPEMFTLMFRHDLLAGSGQNLRATTVPLYAEVVALVRAALPGAGGDAPDRALALWTNVHGLATVTAGRSLELLAPGADPAALAAGLVERHLA